MLPTQALPSDSYEVTATVTGTAGATVALAGAKATSAGVTFWPLDASAALDAAGRADVRFIAASVGEPGNLAPAATLTWARAPAGLDATATVTASVVSPVGYFGRLWLKALGTAYQAANGSVNAADALALGGALAAGAATTRAIRDEMFADTATQLLAEWEASYGLAVREDLTAAQRQARLVAQIRASRAGTPAGILLAVRTLAPEATLTENTAAAVASTNPRNVFRYAIAISAAHRADDDLVAQLGAVLDAMQPAHTDYTLTTRVGFRCDDPLSLVDRDCVGS